MSWLAETAESPGRLRFLGRLFWGGMVLTVAADVVLWAFGRFHGHLWIENLPAFGATVGLLASLSIAGLAKLLAGLFLARKEDYYG